MNHQGRTVDHSRKATCAFAILGLATVCSLVPYGLSFLRHNGPLPSDGAVVGVVIAYYCLLAEVLLWPLPLLELWNPKSVWRKILKVAAGAYFMALATLLFWGVALSPSW